jgi:hypothetical protein
MYQQLNYILFNGIECQINGTSYKDFIYKLKNMLEIQKIGSFIEIGWHYEDEIEPIEINENWLERLGFVRNGNHMDRDGFCFIVNSDYIFLWRPTPDYKIKYVHELQNWYYAKNRTHLVLS